MEYVMSFIEELGYERAKYLVKHPNDKDQRDDLILRKYLIVDVNMLKRYIMEYEKLNRNL